MPLPFCRYLPVDEIERARRASIVGLELIIIDGETGLGVGPGSYTTAQ